MTGHHPRPRHHLWGLPVARFLTLAVLITAAVALSTGAPLHEAPTPTCSGPVTITTGGTYTGCWSTTISAFAVTIATSDPVTITDSTLMGVTRLIGNSVPHVKLTVTNSNFHGLYPRAGTDGDYAIYLIGFDYAHIEHNSVTQKGGFKFGNWSGAASQAPVIVRYNLADNIDGRISNGAGGYSGVVTIQFTQLDHVNNAPGVDISWNEIHNTPYQSAVEDNMNMYCSSGTPASPIEIHDNFVDGAYPVDATAPDYTGGGILLGDNDADIGGNCNGVPPAYMVARDNQVVRTTNYGVSAGAGGNVGDHDLTLRNNTVIDSGLLPGTSTVKKGTNVGVPVWDGVDGNPKPTANVQAYGNTVGWWQAQNSARNDWWLPACSVDCTNYHYDDNRSKISQAEESNQFAVWKNKLAAIGVTTGPTGVRGRDHASSACGGTDPLLAEFTCGVYARICPADGIYQRSRKRQKGLLCDTVFLQCYERGTEPAQPLTIKMIADGSISLARTGEVVENRLDRQCRMTCRSGCGHC